MTRSELEAQPWYPLHPPGLSVREDHLLDAVAHFFNNRVLGPRRRTLLADSHPTSGHDPVTGARRTALQSDLTELNRRQDNILRQMEHYVPVGDPDIDNECRLTLQRRLADLAAQRRTKAQQLAALGTAETSHGPGDPELLDQLPQTALNVTLLTEEQQRAVYDAFHLELRYHHPKHDLLLRVTIDADTLPALTELINAAEADHHTRGRADGTETGSVPQQNGPDAATSDPERDVCIARRAPGGSRTTWERAADGPEPTFVVIDGTWPLPRPG